MSDKHKTVLSNLFLTAFLVNAITISCANANNCWGGSCGSSRGGYRHWSSPRHRRHHGYYYNRRSCDTRSSMYDTVSDIFHFVPEYFNLHVRKIQEERYAREEEMELKRYVKKPEDDIKNLEKERQEFSGASSTSSAPRTIKSNNDIIIEADSRYSEDMGVSENHFDDGSIELELEVPQGISARDLTVEIDENDSIIRVKGIHKIHNMQNRNSQGKLDSIVTRTRLGTIVESKFENIFQVGRDMDITKLKVTLTSSGLLRILVPKKEKKITKMFQILTEGKTAEEDKEDGNDATSTKNKNKGYRKDPSDDTKSSKAEKESKTKMKEEDYDFIIFEDDL